ncbi:MarR family transcriptional regulator [Rhizobium sp. Root1203]|nr:MarR family transcriptional regulator [Rhizobium sp. Root1203]KQV19979.1 MarR family transcriptional regulator [Rhizobium sp. Root1203]
MKNQPGKPRLPDPGEGKRGNDGHIGYLLRQAAGAYRNSLERALANLCVTPSQFAVMTMIKAYPGQSSADLARMALLTPQTVGVIVSNLERAQIILRESHAVHGRIQQIALTEEGTSLLAQCRERVDMLENKLIEGFADGEEAAIRRWLVRIATAR